jgi:ATP-dependent Clp protease ATP-binding subunit ClpA
MKLGRRLKRVLVLANRVASAAKKPNIEPDHLVFATVMEMTEAIPQVLDEMGLDPTAINRRLQERMTLAPSFLDKPRLSQEAEHLMTAATELSQEYELSEAPVEALLITLMRSNVGGNTLLSEVGFSPATASALFERAISPPPLSAPIKDQAASESALDFVIVWNPELLAPQDYGDLIGALGDLVRANGGLGLQRTTGDTVTVNAGAHALT